MYIADTGSGGLAALDRLYRASSHELVAFCRRKGFNVDLAEDVVQQAWLRLIERKPQSRSFIGLLRKTAQNLGFMAMRERPATRVTLREEPKCDPAAVAERNEALLLVRACLWRLKVDDRAFLIACDVGGLNRREACARVGWHIAASTAHQRHVRLRGKLAAALEKKIYFLAKKRLAQASYPRKYGPNGGTKDPGGDRNHETYRADARGGTGYNSPRKHRDGADLSSCGAMLDLGPLPGSADEPASAEHGCDQPGWVDIGWGQLWD